MEERFTGEELSVAEHFGKTSKPNTVNSLRKGGSGIPVTGIILTVGSLLLLGYGLNKMMIRTTTSIRLNQYESDQRSDERHDLMTRKVDLLSAYQMDEIRKLKRKQKRLNNKVDKG